MKSFSFTPFPELETERLNLRRIKKEDALQLFQIRSNDLINEFIDRPKAKSISDVEQFIEKINIAISNDQSVYWVINLKNSDEVIGTICIWNISTENNRAEIGYELLPEFQGKGIMQEAAKKIIDFGFDIMKLDIIDAYTHSKNIHSTKLLEKFDFKRSIELEDVNNHDEWIFSLAKPK